MTSLDLGAFLSGQVFAFLLVFARLSSAFMMFPGLGEAFVPARVRLMFALLFSFMMLPVLAPSLPPLPSQIPVLLALIAGEAFIGLFFGTVMRVLMDIVATMGAIVAMEIGLSNAMILNPALAGQSALPSAFLGVAALALLFATGLDHLVFRALVDTYKVFPVGGELFYGDVVKTYIGLVAKSFLVGVQLATPFIVGGLLLNVVLGVMQRMMPQIQLFLVMLPVQIMGGFFVFSVVVGAALGVWLKVYDDALGSLFIR